MHEVDPDPRDPAQRGAIERLLGSAAAVAPDKEDYVRRVAAQAPEPLLRGHAQVVLASMLHRQGRMPEVESLYRAGLRALWQSDGQAELRACLNYALRCLHSGRELETLLLASRAVALATHLGDAFGLALAYAHIVGALRDLEEHTIALKVLDAMDACVAEVPAEQQRLDVARRAAAYRLEIAANRRDAEAAERALDTLDHLEPFAEPLSALAVRTMAHRAADRQAEVAELARSAQALLAPDDHQAHAFRVMEARAVLQLGLPEAAELARQALDQVAAAAPETLPAGRRQRFAEEIARMAAGHAETRALVERAYAVAGDAALGRVAELDQFLDGIPPTAVEGALARLGLRGLRDRMLAEHIAWRNALGLAGDAPGAGDRLRGVSLCVCAWCRSIRGPDGVWLALDQLPPALGAARTTHGMCTACRRRYREGRVEPEARSALQRGDAAE